MTTKRVMAIAGIALLLLTAGSAQAGPKTTQVVFRRERAADALREAADYLDESGSTPADVEVYDPGANDGLWVVRVTE